MASFNFDNIARALAKADLDFDTVTLKVLLVTAAPNRATMVNRSDMTNELANGNGYATGGIAQAFTLGALDTTNHRQPITFTDVTNGWTGATFTGVVGCVIYKNSGAAATDTLLHYVEFATVTQPTAGTFSLDYTTPMYINA